MPATAGIQELQGVYGIRPCRIPAGVYPEYVEGPE